MDNQSTYQSIVTKCLIQDVKTGTAISNDLMQKKEKKKKLCGKRVQQRHNSRTTIFQVSENLSHN